MEKVEKVLVKPDRSQQVVICLRVDGLYTYRHQWAVIPRPADFDGVWGPMGPECGLYDSCDTAETEAMQRTEWLKSRFN